MVQSPQAGRPHIASPSGGFAFDRVKFFCAVYSVRTGRTYLVAGQQGDRDHTGADNRLFGDPILLSARGARPWRDLSLKPGNWRTVHSRFRRWTIAGVQYPRSGANPPTSSRSRFGVQESSYDHTLRKMSRSRVERSFFTGQDCASASKIDPSVFVNIRAKLCGRKSR